MARILIADDERDIRDLIAFSLRFSGHEVFAASNGEEAIEMGKKLLPDLFVLDVRMPRMTGYEACRVIKKTPELEKIPVIFLSAKGQESEIQQGLEAGAEDYLLKPFDPNILNASVEVVLRNSRLDSLFDSVDPYDKKDEPDDVRHLIKRLKKRNINHFNEVQQYKQKIKQLEEKLATRMLPPPTEKIDQSKTRYPLAELSRVTDGIVHDIRNGIGIIRNTIGFMSEDLARTPHAKDVLKISRSVDFCEVVLRNLSTLGGQEIMRPEWVNLETIVREICFMLENKLVDVNLVVESKDTEPIILADQGHMKQMFMNLIKNAGEAMPNGGILKCRFQKDYGMMIIEIQDTGYGISTKNQQKLFNEFFTTKERGYGIGLFVVHSIVQSHGGKISVKSTERVGTTFTILLPIKEVAGNHE
jgi:signal transduction histidine kinase